jgi:hypothetical protein
MQDTAATETMTSWQRQECCGKSRYLYCPECCALLIPAADRPLALSQALPFDVHVILDDRRPSSTGVQLIAVFRSMSDNNSTATQAELFDTEKDEIPSYETKEQLDGTYLLFPGEDSVPLSSILKGDSTRQPLKTLVLLDCKWSRPSARLHPSISTLPKVSLDCPPSKSYYWRWHNTGEGMLSTVEALYYAAWQIIFHRGWSMEECQTLVRLLWLFRLQRSIIQTKYHAGQVKGVNPYVPFSEEAKEFARKLRQQHRRKEEQKESKIIRKGHDV